MPLFQRSYRLLSLFAIAALLVAGTATAAARTASPAPAQQPRRQDPRAKIHPNLLHDIEAAFGGARRRSAGPAAISFMARVKAGTNLSPYASKWFARPYVDPAGNTVAVGVASPAGLLKLAALPSVLRLQRPESLIEPPAPPKQPVVRKPVAATPQLAPNRQSSPQPNGYFDTTTAIHGSQAAWDKGYTGKGVRLMSNDSGADYCHADLRGTYAYIDTKGSPYYGLPEMFDSFSSYLAARDFYFDEANVANGFADYADTSTTAVRPKSSKWRHASDEEKAVSFQPIGAEAAHTYILPGTSKSGIYHIGSHPDKALADNAALLSKTFGDNSAINGERAAVLVVDSKKTGRYDTVYVDLNFNYDFTDDAPAHLDGKRKYHETACLDYNSDGYNDVSGGLVYFVSDGKRAVPTLDWYWGVPGSTYGNGNLVAFHVMDYDEGGGDHGMGTTSVATGRGRTRGSIYWGPSGPPQAEGKGLVLGPGHEVLTTQNGDFYVSPFTEDGFIYGSLGYDGKAGTPDDIQLVSNSWGGGTSDGGLDSQSRLLDLINRTVNPNTTFLFATGNGAPGAGTAVEPTQPASGIGVGASTLFDEIGIFDPINSPKQIVGGDVVSWSNRGPDALTRPGVDVVATGAFGPGDVPLNEVLDGAVATGAFSGTSMATPVTAGNLALIYQAWRERTGGWPTFQEAREVLMSSAKHIHHNAFSQGAGLVDADRGTDVAGGRAGAFISPSRWSAGGYGGVHRDAFPNIIAPGQSASQTFILTNPSNKADEARLRPKTFERIGTKDLSLSAINGADDHGFNGGPDYVFDVTKDIPAGTDLLQVRVSSPYDQFDPDNNQAEPFNTWAVGVYNWTDTNGDGKVWVDANGNGKVDVTRDNNGNITTSEMEVGEFTQFNYGFTTGPTQQTRVARPLERKADGILVGLGHYGATQLPATNLKVEVSFWHEAKWPWLTLDKDEVDIAGGKTATVKATLKVPVGTQYGLYEGVIVTEYNSDDDNDGYKRDHAIPVAVAVAASSASFSFGGNASAPPALYDNNHLFGYTDYDWRTESGDWRFFWADVPAASVPTSGVPYLLVQNEWEGAKADVDTTVLGPKEDCYSNGVDCPAPFAGFPGLDELYGPYTLGIVGGSVNTYLGSGRWAYQTSSGRNKELVAVPAQAGLHLIELHQVHVDGAQLDEPFKGSTGLVTLSASEVTGGASGSAIIAINSQLTLDGLVAKGFGLSKPTTTNETVNQDDPNDPSTASFSRSITLSGAGKLDISIDGPDGNDLDLFVLDGAGNVVASSTSPTPDEAVSILQPADGTYTILVHGFSVPSGTTTFALTVNAIQGTDVTANISPTSVPAGGTATATISWNAAGKAPGTYEGLVFVGPADAPSLFQIPVTVTVP